MRGIYPGGTAPGVPSGGPQIWYGDRGAITLATVSGSQEVPQTGSCKFRIYTPDGRIRVKVSTMFVRNPGAAGAATTNNATLYLGEEEQDRSGKIGSSILCTDVLRDSSGNVIHQSAPLAIPEDVGLDGFSMEFVTAADSILGIFTTQDGGPGGHWVLQVRFQPDGQRLCDADWDFVKRGCRATLITAEIAV
jgi:hypothetical protein